MGRSNRDVSPLIFLKSCVEQVYNKGMVHVTGYDVIDDDKLFQFLKDAYTKNEDVLIPKELLKDFVQTGCRITICKEVFYKNK